MNDKTRATRSTDMIDEIRRRNSSTKIIAGRRTRRGEHWRRYYTGITLPLLHEPAMTARFFGLIPAAGSGARLGAPLPKQPHPLKRNADGVLVPTP